MSAKAAAMSRSWKVGRYTATLTVPQVRRGEFASAVVEWEPHAPRRLSPKEIAQYQAGRNEALAAVCREIGINGLVVDV